MFNIEVMESGSLRLSADSDAIKWINEQVQLGRDSDTILTDGTEAYWTNGGFTPFDAGMGNPFVGLTCAPCIAESMEIDADGKRLVSGGLWFYGRYMLSDPMEVLMREGQVIFNKVQ